MDLKVIRRIVFIIASLVVVAYTSHVRATTGEGVSLLLLVAGLVSSGYLALSLGRALFFKRG